MAKHVIDRFAIIQWAQAALDLADAEALALGKPAPLYAHVSVSYEQLQAIGEALDAWPEGGTQRVHTINVRGCKFMAWNPAYESGAENDI